ncbi:MAG: hypothetical protein HOB82_03150 [Alphaproteobacteria bacterium]|jgi:TPR repeat protein|nr:hypothetical protein [Alphaproteobacteria bacterium]MBT5859797.1 hypothetical protein [Alphaproteobacteria bacterium]
MKWITTALAVGFLVSASPVFADKLDDGIAAYDAGNFIRAIKLLQPLADQGVAAAQTHLGLMYDEGNGVAVDDAKAIEWYRLAAAQDDVLSLYLMGTMYDLGEGVAEDNDQAVEWYRLAAALNNVYSRQLVESYDKFAIDGHVLAFDTSNSEINDVDAGWLEDILILDPGITTLSLASDGGDPESAFLMAGLIIDFGLDTHVVGDCASACTYIFLAGTNRTMEPDARLGFHQTRWEAEPMQQFYEEWQVGFGWQDTFDFAAWAYSDGANDVVLGLRFMIERGIDPLFAITALETKSDDIWFPTSLEMTAAGVLTE